MIDNKEQNNLADNSEEKFNTTDNIEFIPVCNSNELFEGKGKKIQFPEDDDFQVAIFRVNGKLYCLENICPHRHADSIFDGIIKNGIVTCPLHGWSYYLKNGQNVNQRQGIKSLKSFLIKEEDNTIYIEKPEFTIPKWRR